MQELYLFLSIISSVNLCLIIYILIRQRTMLSFMWDLNSIIYQIIEDFYSEVSSAENISNSITTSNNKKEENK